MPPEFLSTPESPSFAIGSLPYPVARVLGSKHTNPLETLILVTAFSTVMLIAGAIWAVRKWRQMKADAELADSINRLIDAIAHAVGEPVTQCTRQLWDCYETIARCLLETPLPEGNEA